MLAKTRLAFRQTFPTNIERARLNVITGRRPNHGHYLIERAKRVARQRPEPWKDSVIYKRDSRPYRLIRTALSGTS